MARGLGTRMRAEAPHAQLTGGQASMAAKGLKAMIDVGRPFLDHVISELADAGITDVWLVIGPEHTDIIDYYDTRDSQRVRIGYVFQERPLGTGDAVHSARVVVDERFLLINSDNFYPGSVVAQLLRTPGNALAGFSAQGLVANGNIEGERVKAFALMEVEGGRLVTIHEKPDTALLERLGPEAPVSMNCYIFTPRIFEFTGALTPSARGELELPDAVRAAVAAGEVFSVVPTDAGVLDLSARGDISDVVRALADHEVRL